MKRKRYRRDQGSVAALAFVALIPLVAAIGGFAVDCMHMNDGKGELQRATDAAALAGAIDLVNFNGKGADTNTMVSNGNAEPVNVALQVGTMNSADGAQGVYTSAPISRLVTATIWNSQGGTVAFPGTPLSSAPLPTSSSASLPDRCTVDASIQINSIFAKMFGNFTQTINTHSVAGAAQQIDTLLSYFPIIVSSVSPDSYGDPILTSVATGGNFTFDTQTGPGNGNAAWTNGFNSGNDNTFDTIATDILSQQPLPSGSEAQIQVGSTVHAKHGTMDNLESDIAAAATAAPGTVIIIPVTNDPTLSSGPTPNVLITGFVAGQIVSATFDTTVSPHALKITVKLLGKVVANGISTGKSSSLATGQNQLVNVHLIQ